jgi:hypothetical protein
VAVAELAGAEGAVAVCSLAEPPGKTVQAVAIIAANTRMATKCSMRLEK